MATAEQIKALIRSHFTDDTERFFTIALQVAAHEAKSGHSALAHDIRDIVDKERQIKAPRIISFPKDLQGLVLKTTPDDKKSAMVLPKDLYSRLNRIVLEYRQRNKLKSHGLNHRRKILLIGPPGTGKTMTAKVLAHELKLPLYTIQVDRVVTKFMGETSAKLRQIFDLIIEEHGVYLFDEFDAIGGERSLDNDVGEMRRVLNSFLQFIEQDSSDSIIIGASNNPKLLDQALYRRFDDVLYYKNPQTDERKKLMENILGTYCPKDLNWQNLIESSEGLSHADIDQACKDSIKHLILNNSEQMNSELILTMFKERKNVRH